MPERQSDPIFRPHASITPLQNAVCQANMIRELTLIYLPDEALSPDPNAQLIRENILDALDTIHAGLHVTPCPTQWRAAGYENVPQEVRQPFGPALDLLRKVYATPISLLAERTDRHSNTIYRWVREELEPDPLVKKAALASINPEPGK